MRKTQLIVGIVILGVSLLFAGCGTLEVEINPQDRPEIPTVQVPDDTATPYVQIDVTSTPFKVHSESLFEMTGYDDLWGFAVLVPVEADKSEMRAGQLVHFSLQDHATFIGTYTQEIEIIPDVTAIEWRPGQPVTTAEQLVNRAISELAGVSDVEILSPEGSDYAGARLSYPVTGSTCPSGRAVLVGYVAENTGYLMRIVSDIAGYCDADQLPETPFIVSNFRVYGPPGSSPQEIPAVIPPEIPDRDPLFGLVYRQPATGLWHINADGSPFLLLEEQEGADTATLSPDGLQVLLQKGDDIWRHDFSSGEQINLTGTVDRVESGAMWWPANPATILFGSTTFEEMVPSYGNLTSVGVDGSGYLLLDRESGSFSSPGPAPDGTTIAYDRAGSAWRYYLDQGSKPFNLDEFGITTGLDGIKIASPAWSPDGTKLAWVIGGPFADGGEWRLGLVVFDLTDRSVNFLHLYEPVGGGGWPMPPQWSPDAEWLAFQTLSERNRADLWAVRADGSEEHYLGFSSNPVWSPNGKFLVYSELPCDGTPCFSGSVNRIVEAGVWAVETLDLPPESIPVDWVRR